MRRIDHSRYRELLACATVIERDAHGEKLIALPSGEFVKIFRQKKLLSSALLFPYARRFVRNANHLVAHGVPTVTVLDTAYCPAVRRHLVTYRPLPGMTLRNRLRADTASRRAILEKVALFLAELHHRGIYFRSLHFGNVIVSPDDAALGLIDVADMSVRRGPLDIRKRLRNTRHMLRYDEDAGYLREFGHGRFAGLYLASANLDADSQRLFSAFWTNR